MSKSKAADEQWRAFYAVAAEFRDLAPWEWFVESDIFGVVNPETGDTGWCCIMGRAGEHRALAVYRGAAGLDSFLNLSAADMHESPDNPELLNAMYTQDCWMISFEDPKMAPPEQKKHLKALGISFRGAGQWIVVHSHDPGLDPAPVDAADLPFLIHCLQQATDVALRFRTDRKLLTPENILVRTPEQKSGSLVWTDHRLKLDDLPDPPTETPVTPSKAFLDKVRFLPELDGAVVLCSFIVPHAIKENRNTRPWHPMLILALDSNSGMILHMEPLPYSRVPESLEAYLLKVFSRVGGKPRGLGVHHEPLADWLEDICAETGIELVFLSGDEPFLTEVVSSFSGM